MKNNSARKKLIPAAAMLAVSAAMLATSTYAWFTMSKEVEVTGIKLTASVPATVQISLGKGTTTASLSDADSDNIPDDPVNTNDSSDWTNSVAFSDYYKVGLLKPASSVDGLNLFYTENATSQGETVADNAAFTSVGTSKATLNLKSKTVTEYVISGDDNSGYYVDFPVWFRSSQADVVALNVTATITDGNNSSTNALFKSARVSVLEENSGTVVTNAVTTAGSETAQGVIMWGSGTGADSSTGGTTAKDRYFDRYDISTVNQAVSSARLSNATDEVSAHYNAVTAIKQADKDNPDVVVRVPANNTADTTKNYGEAEKKIIRVWLEGEDKNCWNPNAGQDFVIALKFTQVESGT